jgi:hypothetical protein
MARVARWDKRTDVTTTFVRAVDPAARFDKVATFLDKTEQREKALGMLRHAMLTIVANRWWCI